MTENSDKKKPSSNINDGGYKTINTCSSWKPPTTDYSTSTAPSSLELVLLNHSCYLGTGATLTHQQESLFHRRDCCPATPGNDMRYWRVTSGPGNVPLLGTAKINSVLDRTRQQISVEKKISIVCSYERPTHYYIKSLWAW